MNTARNNAGMEATCPIVVLDENANTISLPLALTTVEEEAFYGIDTQRVDLPNGVQSIGSKAFAGSPSLLLVIIPNTNATIDIDAFECSENVAICAPAGGRVQQYADSCGIPFIPIF